MTPTQAQIEAAIEAFSKSAGYPIAAKVADGSLLRTNLIAALTAAAEVGEPKTYVSTNVDPLTRLPATYQWPPAAEVGEPSKTPTVDGIIHHIITSDTNATIERCAQVAENVAVDDSSRKAIATAIRAIKN